MKNVTVRCLSLRVQSGSDVRYTEVVGCCAGGETMATALACTAATACSQIERKTTER